MLPDGNDFLRQVFENLEAAAQRRPGELAVQGIRSVNEIRPAVRAFSEGGAPVLLQLVGHGRPGELELSFSWDRRYRDDLRFYLLDNNSRELLLLAGCKGLVEEVRLVACNVGAEEGHPLLFTLSKLLGCTISAALGSVSPAMFQASTGLYAGPMTVCAPGTQRFSVLRPSEEAAARATVIGLRAELQVDPAGCRVITRAVRAVRSFALMGRRAVTLPLTEQEGEDLVTLVAPLAGAVHGSSVPELELEVELQWRQGAVTRCGLLVMSDRTARLLDAPADAGVPPSWRVEMRSEALTELVARYRATWLDAIEP